MEWQRRIALQVAQIPKGKVATYGQIAQLIPGVTPRMVGWALAALGEESDIPWQRVVNAKGTLSPRPGGGAQRQKEILIAEGVTFSSRETIDFKRYRWKDGT